MLCKRAGANLGRITQTEPGRSWVVVPIAGTPGSDQLALVSKCRGSGARGGVYLREDVADMAIDGLLAERQFSGNRLVGLTGRNQPQHLQLAVRQTVLGCRGCPGPLVESVLKGFDDGDVRRRTELLEYLVRALKLEPRPLGITQCDAGACREDTHPRRKIRRPEPLPDAERAPGRLQYGMRIALSEVDRAAGVRRDRLQHISLDSRCGLAEFEACSSRLIQIADGQHDFDMGREEPGARESIAGSTDGAAAGRGRRIAVALSQTQER